MNKKPSSKFQNGLEKLYPDDGIKPIILDNICFDKLLAVISFTVIFIFEVIWNIGEAL